MCAMLRQDHFLAEGSRVSNELPVEENYKARQLALLDRIDQGAPQKVDNPFPYNSWQA